MRVVVVVCVCVWGGGVVCVCGGGLTKRGLLLHQALPNDSRDARSNFAGPRKIHPHKFKNKRECTVLLAHGFVHKPATPPCNTASLRCPSLLFAYLVVVHISGIILPVYLKSKGIILPVYVIARFCSR